MDKIAEKVGLYDFWAVFFPGAIGLIAIAIDYHLMTINGPHEILFNWELPKNILAWIIFLITSIFVGIIFQEIGRGIRKAFRLTNAAEGLLDQKKKIFSKNEIKFFEKTYSDLGYKNEKTPEESKRIFHVINIKAQRQGLAAGFVKLSIQQNMALSLMALMVLEVLFSFIAVIYLFCLGRCGTAPLALIVCVVSVLLCIVFMKRSERFYRYWVRNVVYSVCYRTLE